MSEIHSWHFHIPVPDPLGMEAIVRTINLLARNAPRLDLSATQHHAAETRTGIYQSSSSSPGPGLTKLNEYAEEHGAPAFALFTKLPLELRLQVVSYVLYLLIEGPRLIYIDFLQLVERVLVICSPSRCRYHPVSTYKRYFKTIPQERDSNSRHTENLQRGQRSWLEEV